MLIDLVIPARNEADNIDALFDALPAGLFRCVVVCDNGSTDATASLAESRGAVVVREDRMGYGRACLAGLAWIQHQAETGDVLPDAVAFVDADLSDDPGQMGRLIDPLESDQADLVLGARAALADPGALDPHQRFGNWLACTLTRLASGRAYRDLGPMRVIRWSSLEQLEMGDETWGWTIEMQYKAVTRGVRTLEIDVPYRKRRAGRSKITGSLWMSARVGIRIVSMIGWLWWSERRVNRSGSGA
ncbi:glycosyltransferase family 2 protein [Mucisphaera calidilacus]|uniref:Glycosyl transferase family 2 n=1 Tax=Mucisphaera calidilacus TaxID=2527982 RepID=A0A518BWA5_9BACT|nr:glycosyltransferase family 2 protein [Mucisphaera calidilacus]QDU71250.1 Glycosyl transferase family 2 [Mucisphaera calidilacus]